MISTVGAFIIAAGVVLFLWDLARKFRFTVEDDAGNVYGGGTLEWLPTGLYSVRSIPVVRSRYPLWDDPDLSDDVEQGRYFLPGAPTGHRETIITSPIRAEPEYLQIMPGPSAASLFAAVFTAGFFLLLTIQAYTPAVVSGVLAVAAMIKWLWQTDRPVALEAVDVGGGIRLPTYVTGPRTHGWWALVILLIVIGMIFLMTVFSYLYLYGVHPEFWRSPPDLWWLLPILVGYGGAAALAMLARRLLAREKTTLWTPPTLMSFAALGLLCAVLIEFRSWNAAGLDPQLSGQGAMVYAFVSLQALVTAVAVLMTAYLAARNSRGLVTRPRNNTFDLTTIFLVYAAAQGTIGTLLARLFPGAL